MRRRRPTPPGGSGGAAATWHGGLLWSGIDRERTTRDDPTSDSNRKPIRSASVSTFTLDDTGAGTVVTWSSTGPTTLATRVMGIFTSMDRVLGPLFAEGLANLSDDAEPT